MITQHWLMLIMFGLSAVLMGGVAAVRTFKSMLQIVSLQDTSGAGYRLMGCIVVVLAGVISIVLGMVGAIKGA